MFDIVRVPTEERLPVELMTSEFAGAFSWKITDLFRPNSAPLATSTYPAIVVVPVESKESPEDDAVRIPVTVRLEIVVVAKVEFPVTSKVEEKAAEVPVRGLEVVTVISFGISPSSRSETVPEMVGLVNVTPVRVLILFDKAMAAKLSLALFAISRLSSETSASILALTP